MESRVILIPLSKINKCLSTKTATRFKLDLVYGWRRVFVVFKLSFNNEISRDSEVKSRNGYFFKNLRRRQ